MGYWENNGESDEWFTPAYIFDALDEIFDVDVAAPEERVHVPCRYWLTEKMYAKGAPHTPDNQDWNVGRLHLHVGSGHVSNDAFVWMNPPFGGRNGIVPWLDKFFAHGNGIALTPDRTSTDWWQDAAQKADAVLFMRGKVKFERPDGSVGKSPSNGTTLFAAGDRAVAALRRASTLGIVMEKQR